MLMPTSGHPVTPVPTGLHDNQVSMCMLFVAGMFQFHFRICSKLPKVMTSEYNSTLDTAPWWQTINQSVDDACVHNSDSWNSDTRGCLNQLSCQCLQVWSSVCVTHFLLGRGQAPALPVSVANCGKHCTLAQDMETCVKHPEKMK